MHKNKTKAQQLMLGMGQLTWCVNCKVTIPEQVYKNYLKRVWSLIKTSYFINDNQKVKVLFLV